MVWRNSEHYPDPTPVAARRLRVNWRYDVAGMMKEWGGGGCARTGGL